MQHVPGFLLWMRPLLLAHCVNLDVHLYYAAVQNLVCGHGNVLQTTAERSDTPPIHCTQHVQQSIDMSIQLPADLLCDPIQMAELQEQMQDAWDNLSKMTFGIFMIICMREYMFVLLLEGSYTSY